MNKFYQSIARHYDHIFPLSDGLKKFLYTFGITNTDHILDIGCATGEVVFYLAPYAQSVTGIDLDPDLIEIARSKKNERGRKNVAFFVRDMLDIDNVFIPDQFRIVLCLGNTLVHLLSRDTINNFLGKVSNILSGNGMFIFQILNYEKILEQRTRELPLIDNDKIIFRRSYDHDTQKPLLVFDTSLTVKASSETINNSITLYPLRQEELIQMSNRHLYRSIQFYGGFDGRAFNAQHDLLIGVWQK
jgi:SAM-dependent methyltransferase